VHHQESTGFQQTIAFLKTLGVLEQMQYSFLPQEVEAFTIEPSFVKRPTEDRHLCREAFLLDATTKMQQRLVVDVYANDFPAAQPGKLDSWKSAPTPDIEDLRSIG
jgi:hypothetical protein